MNGELETTPRRRLAELPYLLPSGAKPCFDPFWPELTHLSIYDAANTAKN